MKHYFLVAKDVGDLTRIVCAELEDREAKNVPRLNRLLRGFTRAARRSSRARTTSSSSTGASTSPTTTCSSATRST